jgi:hypothetical protein
MSLGRKRPFPSHDKDGGGDPKIRKTFSDVLSIESRGGGHRGARGGGQRGSGSRGGRGGGDFGSGGRGGGRGGRNDRGGSVRGGRGRGSGGRGGGRGQRDLEGRGGGGRGGGTGRGRPRRDDEAGDSSAHCGYAAQSKWGGDDAAQGEETKNDVASDVRNQHRWML